MFNGGSDQFHQFIASSRTSTTTTTSNLPLTLPHNNNLPINNNNVSSHHPTFSSFMIDPHHHQLSHQVFQSHLLHQLHSQSNSQHEDDDELKNKQEERLGDSCRVRSTVSHQMVNPWEKEEVLELLRIRSNMGNNGFSDYIWSHVSRKLGELGYKRSAEKCKEKFEEMNQYCIDSTNYSKKNYRSFSELEALFEDNNQNPNSTSLAEDEKMVTEKNMSLNLEENSGNETLENPDLVLQKQSMMKKQAQRRKRKRHQKLELLKGVCEEIVNKIMVQQEEIHEKLLQEMERKEEERVAIQEAWKKKEMDRINKEIEIRAQEQVIACERENTIIEFLKKFTSSQNQELIVLRTENIRKTAKTSPSCTSPSSSENNPNSLSRVPAQTSQKVPTSSTIGITTKNPSSCPTQKKSNVPISSHLDLAYQNPTSLTTTQNNQDVTSSSTHQVVNQQDHNTSSTTINDRDQENGKRWPRDEVNSLINLRCNLCSNVGEDKENSKVPLWEKISQGMLELGYKRSARKCKEKWENINKYFRKTKDTNKKRSLDSKTCPYFHQLNTLYNQGRLVLPSDGTENNSTSTENRVVSPETRASGGLISDQAVVPSANESDRNNNTQVSPLEFEY